jgi:urease accessory protein
MRLFRTVLPPAAALLFAAGGAEAHTFGTHGAGFASGLAHPFLGVDHVLAMVAAGLWAAQLGGRALWAVPAAFIAVMTVGGALGMAGVSLGPVELGIAASLVVLGALVALGVRLPLAAAAALVGAFALFHGHAHGTELPEAASALGYAGGFVVATALLHGIGVAAGRALRRGAARPYLRLSGAAIAAVGILLIAF